MGDYDWGKTGTPKLGDGGFPAVYVCDAAGHRIGFSPLFGPPKDGCPECKNDGWRGKFDRAGARTALERAGDLDDRNSAVVDSIYADDRQSKATLDAGLEGLAHLTILAGKLPRALDSLDALEQAVADLAERWENAKGSSPNYKHFARELRELLE